MKEYFENDKIIIYDNIKNVKRQLEEKIAI